MARGPVLPYWCLDVLCCYCPFVLTRRGSVLPSQLRAHCFHWSWLCIRVWTLESLCSFLLIVLSYVLRLCTKPCLWYCMRLLSLRSLPKLTLLSEEIIQFKLHFQWACSALGGSSCNPGSLRYSCIHFHCLRVWLFLNVLENPSKCRLLCYKFIIQFGLNDGLTVPTAL